MSKKTTKADEPHELSTDEIRTRFIDRVRGLVDYWERDVRTPCTRGKLSGLAHSILAVLDGCSVGITGFIVAPTPHPDDKKYRQDNKECWYPENHKIEDKVKGDISGSLHDHLYKGWNKA